MTNLPKLHQALHDASDEEIVGALHYLGKAARIAAALNAQAAAQPQASPQASAEVLEALRSARLMHNDRQGELICVTPDKWEVIRASQGVGRE